MIKHTPKKFKQTVIEGFTLVEMVVAVAVFAVISVASYSTINVVLNGRSIINQKHEQLSSLQRMHALMKNDFRYALNRSVRNEFGDTEAPFMANQDGELFRLTTLYPRVEGAGKLKRVSWVVEDGSVWRNEFAALDRGQEEGKFRREIIQGVELVNMYFFENKDSEVERKTDWDSVDTLPVAVELELELSSKQNYRWLFGGSGL